VIYFYKFNYSRDSKWRHTLLAVGLMPFAVVLAAFKNVKRQHINAKISYLLIYLYSNFVIDLRH